MSAAADAEAPAIPPGLMHLERIADGVYWASIYWMEGSAPKQAAERSEINSGVPHLGWGRCFVVDRDPKSKMVVLFDPFGYEGFQVSRRSYEYTSLTRASHPYDREWHVRNFKDKWEQAQRNHWQRDFDTALLVMKCLGIEPPSGVPDGLEAKVKGGKEAAPAGLLKPVRRASRTGQILAFFWPKPASVRSAMLEFSMSRSNVLSQLYQLTKVHGIGYELKGDEAFITMPPGCEDPWATDQQRDRAA